MCCSQLPDIFENAVLTDQSFCSSSKSISSSGKWKSKSPLPSTHYLIMWEPPRDQTVLFAQKHRSLGSFKEDKNGPGASYGCDLEWCTQRQLWETHQRTATTGWEAHLQQQKQWASHWNKFAKSLVSIIKNIQGGSYEIYFTVVIICMSIFTIAYYKMFLLYIDHSKLW